MTGDKDDNWEGYVSNDETYLNLRKALFDNTVKVLKLHPERKITLLSLGFKKRLDVKKPEDSKMIITMLAADTRVQYSTGVRHSGSNIITSGHSANDKRPRADSARMDADRYRRYHKSSNKQWRRQDGVIQNA